MPSLQVQKMRDRVADVNYEIEKLNNRLLFLAEGATHRTKDKEYNLSHNIPWLPLYQMGLEQTELEIVVVEAMKVKLVNEIKFLRLMIEETLAAK